MTGMNTGREGAEAGDDKRLGKVGLKKWRS